MWIMNFKPNKALSTVARSLSAIALTAFSATASGQAPAAWPTKPIALVVTYPPGGGADAMARLIAPKLGEALGQNVIVENKPGAGGQIGAAAVAKAAPDGYTLMLDASSFAVNPSLYPKLPYDTEKAFRPIGVIALFPNVVLVNAQFPAKNVAELIAAAKVKKDAVSFASSGNGSAQHLAGALFESAAKVDMVHVPYKGGGPAINDLLGGQVDAAFVNINSIIQHIKAGKVRALAVASEKRNPLLPDVPTLAEQGVKGAEVQSWQAVAAPKGLPADIKLKLHGAIVAGLNEPAVKDKLVAQGFEIVTNTPEQFTAYQASEYARWKKLIESRKITAD